MTDTNWKRMVMERDDWTCQNCGTNQHLDAAHIVPRTVKATRDDVANGVTLCRNCHVWYTQCPQMWTTFVDLWKQNANAPLCGEHLDAPTVYTRQTNRMRRGSPSFSDAWAAQINKRNPIC